MKNQRGHSFRALYFEEDTNGLIYELYRSDTTYGIYSINPDGRRKMKLRFCIKNGCMYDLTLGKIDNVCPDWFMLKSFNIAIAHNVMEL